MRDPDRIERIGLKLIKLWRLVPDYRLGQLVENMVVPGHGETVFYVEDDVWERRIDKVLEEAYRA